MARTKKSEEITWDESDNPFPDEADMVAADLNDSSKVDLRPFAPPPVGGQGDLHSILTGEGSVGRPTSPKIWANAHLHPSVAQLRVWRKINGVLHLIGLIDKDVNEEEFIQAFYTSMPKRGEGSGTFVIRPIGSDGNETGYEITLPPISEHHSEIRRLHDMHEKADRANGGDVAPVIRLQQELVTATAQHARHVEMQAIKKQEEIAKERMEMAAHTVRSVEALAERTMQQEALRNKELMAAQAGVFQTLHTLHDSAAERERTAAEARRKEEEIRRIQDRQDFELKMKQAQAESDLRFQQMQADADRRWQQAQAEADRRERQERQEREDREKREERRAAEREKELQRQHEMRVKELEIQAQRDREHQERMAQLMSASNKSESIEGMLERGTKLLGMFGVQPKDLVDKFLTGDEGGSNLSEMLTPIIVQGIQTVGEVAKTVMAQQAKAAATPKTPAQQISAYVVPPQALPQQPQPVPVGAPMGEAPQAAAVQESSGPRSNLPLNTQKNARVAIRELVRGLKKEPVEAWQGLVLGAIQKEFAIYHYCKDVTIRGALVEGGADDALIEAFFAHPAVQAIPADVPRE